MEQTKIKGWKIFAILIGFPIVYILFGKTYVAIELFSNRNPDYYILFWGGIVILHWASVLVILQVLKSHGKTIAEIGYKLSRKETLLFIGGYLLVALVVLVGVEAVLMNFELDSAQFGSISGLIQKQQLTESFLFSLSFLPVSARR